MKRATCFPRARGRFSRSTPRACWRNSWRRERAERPRSRLRSSTEEQSSADDRIQRNRRRLIRSLRIHGQLAKKAIVFVVRTGSKEQFGRQAVGAARSESYPP